MQPDELLPRSVWLYAVMPVPRFPAATADTAFGVEDVVGSTAEVAARAFTIVENWGYRAIGRYQDVANNIEALGYSSGSATVWVALVTGLLTVFVTPYPEGDPTRLNRHLATHGRTDPVAAWGAFPVDAGHIPAVARMFEQAAKDLLTGGAPDFKVLGSRLEAAAAVLSGTVWRRQSLATAQELAHAGRHRAAVRILSYWESELLPEQRALLETERRAAITEPSLLERGTRTDREWFTARAELITAKHTDLMAPNRPAEAAVDFHDARDLLYDDLEQAIKRSKLGDKKATDYLITFVEADPWCFRSGYMKGRLYDLLRRGNYDETARQRLRAVLLMLVDVGYRIEFRSACRLARQIADADLIGALRARLGASPDRHLRRRALWMLCYVPTGLEEQGPAVLEVTLDAAGEADWWRVAGWASSLCRRFADDEFDEKIRTLAFSSEEASARRGLRLLPSGLRQPLDPPQRLHLESIIVDAVHERGPGIGLMESLATIADTKHLRLRLAALAQGADSPVNNYARWALNAAIRANGDEAPDL